MTWEGDLRTSTAEWKKLRKRALRRDGQRCTWVDGGVRCENAADEVDHRVNVKSGGSDDLSNLQSLCAMHHAIKTSAEGNAARWRNQRRRPVGRHPGEVVRDARTSPEP